MRRRVILPGSTSSTKMPFHGYWSLPEETIGSLPTSWHGCALKSPKRRSGPAPTDFGKRPPRRYTGSSDGPHAIPYVQECRPFPQICAQSTRKQRDTDPYKGFFKKAVSKEDAEAYKAEPMKLVAWVAQNIRVDNDCNLGGAPISPEGV